MQPRKTIRFQIVIVICGIIFLSFLSFFIIVRQILISDYRQLMKKNDAQLSQIISYNISRSIEHSLGLVHMTALYPHIMQLSEQEKLNLLKRTVIEEPLYESFAVVNAQDEQVVNAFRAVNPPIVWYEKFKDIDRPEISPAYYSSVNQHLMFTVVHEIEERGKTVGAIVADINLKSVREFINKYNKESPALAYLIDQDGNVIAQPNDWSEGIYNYYNMTRLNFQRNDKGYLVYDENQHPILVETEFDAPPGLVNVIRSAVEGKSGASSFINKQGEKFYCIYEPVSLPFLKTHWAVVLVRPALDMSMTVDHLFFNAMIGGLIILIIASFAIMYFSEKLVRPIFQIVEMANRVRAGDLSGQLEIKTENEIGLLADNINHMIQGLRATRQKSKEAESRIKNIAYHDTLTGLPNRMHFMVYLREMLEKSVQGRFYGSLLFIDVDKFKSINDTYGHAVGDGLLIAFAKRIIEIVGRKEIVCRYGGDEFLLFLPGYNFDDTRSTCEHLVKSMNEPFNISGNEFALSTSIGAALFPKDANNIDELMEKADAALYVSKRNGRNQYNFYKEGMTIVQRD